MAWCRQATNHYLNQCWPRSLPPYGITRPQWVNYVCHLSVEEWYKLQLYLTFLEINSSTRFNPLKPSDAIWRHRSGSTLAQVMACCRTAPSHYLNQCWLIINGVLWYSPCNNFTGSACDISSWYEFENYNFEIMATSPRCQWVNHGKGCNKVTPWSLIF